VCDRNRATIGDLPNKYGRDAPVADKHIPETDGNESSAELCMLTSATGLVGPVTLFGSTACSVEIRTKCSLLHIRYASTTFFALGTLVMNASLASSLPGTGKNSS